MKREIKFRAWNKKDKVMVDVAAINFGPSGLWSLIEDADDAELQLADSYELMQYTGLHDKNGREVYEGDIVKNEYGKVMEVQYDPRSAAFGVGDYYFGTIGSGKTLEVIGNIFDNPELLEGKQ
ncbi:MULTISPECIES: YopX family protein [Lacticaseibacillus]|uniref:YopX family protein n=1 Tax=Lacticaseibacillus TaxID=2759736 RepID=UPI0005E7B8DE|nr:MULTISPECIES: YopX family protein [Lacticaseibacillus]MXI83358.1 hypothetical protein [Lacticaseibacillus paracasei]OAT94162.1 hypothetical protein PY94_07485 [Lacticaseibacillus rhamnosus]CDN24561.1 prophage P1 protein 30 [Lacticaseibacillus rhamnosus]